MQSGWICIHRALLDHWIFQEPEALKLWLYLLLKANHSDKSTMFNKSLIDVKRGQVITGRHSLVEKLGITERKVRRYIDTLEIEGMIVQQKTNKYSIISIVKYEQYQDNVQQTSSKRPTDVQQTSTSKQYNNENNKEQVDKPALILVPDTSVSVVGTKVPPCPHLEIIEAYHRILPELPAVVTGRWANSTRAKNLQARWKESPKHQKLKFWERFFEELRNHPFYMGQNDRGWTASLAWLVERGNFDKMIEKFINASRKANGA